ncbi:MAG: response regulator [Desulfosarcina sp.]|jgi:two-component system, OmpR family, response regulator
MQPLVMVVDDEEKVRRYLSRLLVNRGFTVDAAADGEAALALMADRDFDVVLLDVLMPGLDGIAVLKEIKKRRPLTEVIILTGNASVNTGVAGMQHGAIDYLLKPVNLDSLMVCLREALEQRRFRQSQPPDRPEKHT